MRVTTKITWDIDGNVIEHEYYDYEGPVALCDRAASSAAKSAVGDATTQQGALSQAATNERAALTPFFQREMNAQHGFSPTQLNELLTSAGAGLGAASGAAQNQADQLAADTRNASGFTKSLQEQARDRMKTAAGLSEGIAGQDVLGAKQLNQEGAAGMQGLYGTDVNGMLGAMGQRNAAINTQIEAGKSGWLQNLNSTLGTVAKLGQAFMPKPPGGMS